MNVTPDSETVHAAPVPAARRDVPAHAGGHARRVLRPARADLASRLDVASRPDLASRAGLVAERAARCPLAAQRLVQHAVARRPARLRWR